MKNIMSYIILLLIALLLSGCGVITNKLYIQEANLESNLNSPPLNITKNKTAGSITVSPGISINSQKNISGSVMEHTKVNSSNVFQVDSTIADGSISYKESGKNVYSYKGNNMHWNLPEAALGLNIDVALSDRFALTIGANTYFQNEKSSVGGHAGIGYFKSDENSGIRLEGGILWQKIYYDISSVLITTYEPFWGDKTTNITFMSDKSSKACLDYYATLTFNSNSQSNFIDFFLSLGFFSQTLLEFEHKNPDPGYYIFGNMTTYESGESDDSATILFVNPGLTINLNDKSRINLGAKMHLINGVSSISNNFLFTPMIQFDMMF